MQLIAPVNRTDMDFPTQSFMVSEPRYSKLFINGSEYDAFVDSVNVVDIFRR